MEILNQTFQIIESILNFLNRIDFLFILGLFILFYHILRFFTKDLAYLNAVKKNPDPEIISQNDLKDLPLINIIVPAWKEGKEFRDCLISITKLNYPHIKAIINAGGNDETIEIAESFKNYENLIILRQTKGSYGIMKGKGKISALNQCLDYVSEGIIYLIDADCYITDEILIRMIYPITNGNEKVVTGAGIRPLKSIEKIDLVKYQQFDRLGLSRFRFTRYVSRQIGGATTCITYEVLRSIGKFSEYRTIAEDVSRGMDIFAKGYKNYGLSDFRSRLYSDYPKTIKEYIKQRKKNLENIISFSIKYKKKKPLIKVLLLILTSIYVLLSPILLFINLGFFLIALLIIYFIYLKKIRRFIFFKLIINKKYYTKFRIILVFKIFYYIIIELISNFLILFRLKPLIKTLKDQNFS